METMGLGAGSYPEPKERKTRTIEGIITVEYGYEFEIPEEYTKEEELELIKENVLDITCIGDVKGIRID